MNTIKLARKIGLNVWRFVGVMKTDQILDSWKEIAAYLNRSIRTCHRFEQELGLPVHRLDDSPKARVYAYKNELDTWLETVLRSSETLPAIAVLPFEKIYNTLASFDLSSLQDFRGMKGKIIYRDGEILSGMNLLRILQIVPKLGFLDRILEKWPKGAHFEYMRDSYQIVRYIPFLLQPCRKTKSKRKLGFLTLLTDGNSEYWYSAYRDFLHSLEESISSLEALIDEDVNTLSVEQENTVNEAYRHLTTMISE